VDVKFKKKRTGTKDQGIELEGKKLPTPCVPQSWCFFAASWKSAYGSDATMKGRALTTIVHAFAINDIANGIVDAIETVSIA
jgi:hypothetical protein